MLSLARKGCAIFLGRGVDRILPLDRGLRVRLVAPLEYRIQRLAELRGLTLEQSRDEVARIERERGDFIKSRYQIHVDEPTRFDVTVNMAKFDDDQAIDLILAARKLLGGTAVGG